jgi:flagellar protein FlbD
MDPLIQLRRLGGAVFALNPDLIERAEATPDTVVTLVGGNKYVVLESLAELTELIREHRTQILASAEILAMEASLQTGASVASKNARLLGIARSAHEHDTAVVPLRPKDA